MKTMVNLDTFCRGEVIENGVLNQCVTASWAFARHRLMPPHRFCAVEVYRVRI